MHLKVNNLFQTEQKVLICFQKQTSIQFLKKTHQRKNHCCLIPCYILYVPFPCLENENMNLDAFLSGSVIRHSTEPKVNTDIMIYVTDFFITVLMHKHLRENIKVNICTVHAIIRATYCFSMQNPSKPQLLILRLCLS